jgi:DUF1365 family protein
VTAPIQHIAGETYHGRLGATKNAFRYSIDYLLLDAENDAPRLPRLFSRNRANLMALYDSDHGGPPKAGRGAAWVRDVLARYDVPQPDRIMLLAQPRVLGHVFNPVSFWLCYDGDDLTTVIAEVTNTFGDRHSYLCRHEDGRMITKGETLAAQKVMHVSPFQPIEGGYVFRFDIGADAIGIWIDYTRGNGGVIATLTGALRPISNASILRAVLRRPFGSRRVLALIHWQALKLWWKGATFRSQPAPPKDEVTR